ncbi:MAG: ribbon-helix-helix domain-containing protein [Planctomycetota bacterium]|jgi:Arc/MetJ-type ribon-helix-helix transcriptional regulator
MSDECLICDGLDVESIMGAVRTALGERGIDFEALCECGTAEGEKAGKPKVKVVCVAPNLKESVQEMGDAARTQVVMVRVDAETAARLDAWVETGAVKSRSEAAALFIREGLKVRESELEKLRDALNEVHAARDRLKRQAREAFGTEEGEASGD